MKEISPAIIKKIWLLVDASVGCKHVSGCQNPIQAIDIWMLLLTGISSVKLEL
jgi:hypothetical protein